jgi:hypothetical protein
MTARNIYMSLMTGACDNNWRTLKQVRDRIKVTHGITMSKEDSVLIADALTVAEVLVSEYAPDPKSPPGVVQKVRLVRLNQQPSNSKSW